MGLGPVVDGLRAQGLSFSAPSGLAGISGGGGAYLGRIHIGGEGGSFFGGKAGGGAGWARLGYFFPLRGGFIIMPVGMIGGGGLTLQIRDDGTAVSFGQIAATHVPIQSLSTGGMLTGAAIEVQKNLGGFLLGLSAGYLTGPSWKDWETAEGRGVTNGPRVSLGMPYVRLQIGGRGWASPEKQVLLFPPLYQLAVEQTPFFIRTRQRQGVLGEKGKGICFYCLSPILSAA
jgi:hypothetical protein